MKKVGLIASLACLFTVGGVYATWTYATGGVVDKSVSLSPQMAAVGTPSNKGTIHIKSSTLTLEIDQKSLTDYHPVMTLGGYIDVWFEPALGASEDVITNGIKMKVNITQTDDWTYIPHELDNSATEDATNIFDVDPNASVNINLGDYVLHDADHPYRIEADEIKDLIELNVLEEIDTLQEWTIFKGHLEKENKQFTVIISEK